MTIDEAIKVFRQHNEKGTSVLRITKGQALEKDLLAQVLDSCEQLISERAEYKRLLKAAVEDFAVYGALKDLPSEQRVQNPDWRRFNRVFDVLDHQWRYTDKALKLMGDEPNGIYSI